MAGIQSSSLAIVAVLLTLPAIPALVRAFFRSSETGTKETPDQSALVDALRTLVGLMPRGSLVPNVIWFVLVWSALAATIYFVLVSIFRAV